MATPRAAWMLAADASQTCQPAASSSASIFPLACCSGCGAKTSPFCYLPNLRTSREVIHWHALKPASELPAARCAHVLSSDAIDTFSRYVDQNAFHRHIPPTAYAKNARRPMLQPGITLVALGKLHVSTPFGKAHQIAEFFLAPTGFQVFFLHRGVHVCCIGFQVRYSARRR